MTDTSKSAPITDTETSDGLPPGEWWMFYDHQTGKWCVYDDGPPKVIRTGAEVFHVREVRDALRDALRAQVALAADPAYLATAIDKVGMVDKEWKARAEAAEAQVATLQAKLEKAAEALEWYGEQARLARLMHSGGDAGRHALQDDGGKRARSTLSTLREAGNEPT